MGIETQLATDEGKKIQVRFWKYGKDKDTLGEAETIFNAGRLRGGHYLLIKEVREINDREVVTRGVFVSHFQMEYNDGIYTSDLLEVALLNHLPLDRKTEWEPKIKRMWEEAQAA
jgi:hypothetical protein